MSEHYAYLAIYDQHLNLGCNYGALLPDPAGLLGGTGAGMRSRRITALEDLRDLGQHTLVDLTVAATPAEVRAVADVLNGREGVVTIADSSFEA